MLDFLRSLNWTAVIITVLVCSTSLRLAERMKSIARIWLEGIRTEKEIEAIRHSGWREYQNRK